MKKLLDHHLVLEERNCQAEKFQITLVQLVQAELKDLLVKVEMVDTRLHISKDLVLAEVDFSAALEVEQEMVEAAEVQDT